LRKEYEDLESETFKWHIINTESNYQLDSLLCVPFSDHRLIVSIAHPPNRIFSKSWSIYVNEDGVFEFPEVLLQKLDWNVGDEVEWVEKDNGTFTLTKINGIAPEKNARPHRAKRRKAERKIKMGANSA
jgi:hypothetical protein